MKGTLFSADFVKDNSGNLRLLELNTDTSFTSGALHHVDFTDFINVLSTNNIDEVHVIHKSIHKNLVTELSESLHTSGIISTFNTTLEDINTIYPTSVDDSSSKFILRCAYDESAIFDSIYCKQKDQLLKLFHDNSNAAAVSQFYLSSSEDSIDLLDKTNNIDSVPDVVVKNILDVHGGIEFYKVAGTGSAEENFNSLLDGFSEDRLIINYYNNESDTKHKAQRSFNIIYGSNLDLINLADVEVESILEKPTSIDFDPTYTMNLIDEKHYYEFTSNFPKVSHRGVLSGIFEDEEITDATGSAVRVSDLVIGESYKAIAIEGTPDSDSPDVYTEWFYSGSTMPQSEVTSSVLINKVEYDLTKKLINNVVLENSASFRANPLQSILVYDSNDDGFRYKHVYDIDPSIDKLIKLDESKVGISTNEIEVLEEDHKTYVLDFETADTFILHDSELNLKIVAHNCFPAGTRILLATGEYKNIEKLTSSDELMTYDSESGEFGKGCADAIRVTTQDKLIHITTEDGNSIKSTPGHKFYVNQEWKPANEISEGDILLTKGNNEVSVTSIETLSGAFEVYHIINVEGNHTYFAENILVHNAKFNISCFPADTQIEMEGTAFKMIQDVVVGDMVVTINETTNEKEIKEVYEVLKPIHDDIVIYTLADGTIIESTFDHPYYVENYNIKSYYPEKTNSVYDIGKPVSKIEIGDAMIKSDGSIVSITNIEEKETQEIQTYLLRVKDNHNFFANGVLVHNK
jgi:hypothetical protein